MQGACNHALVIDGARLPVRSCDLCEAGEAALARVYFIWDWEATALLYFIPLTVRVCLCATL